MKRPRTHKNRDNAKPGSGRGAERPRGRGKARAKALPSSSSSAGVSDASSESSDERPLACLHSPQVARSRAGRRRIPLLRKYPAHNSAKAGAKPTLAAGPENLVEFSDGLLHDMSDKEKQTLKKWLADGGFALDKEAAMALHSICSGTEAYLLATRALSHAMARHNNSQVGRTKGQHRRSITYVFAPDGVWPLCGRAPLRAGIRQE